MTSLVDTGAGVKVVRTNEGMVRMVLVCAVMSGYIVTSSSPEYVNGALASVFNRASFPGAHSAVNFSGVRRNEESVSGSMSSVT